MFTEVEEAAISENSVNATKKKKRIKLPSSLFTAAKYAKVITIHSYDFNVKVSTEDLQ